MIFLTGGTGFLGSYVLDWIRCNSEERIFVLTRAKNNAEAEEKLWKALQLHMNVDAFWAFRARVEFVFGDLTEPNLGIGEEQRKTITPKITSVLHIAASLNRKSEKACLNQNLRGTLSVIKLAKEVHEDHGLRRFSHVSTVAVAGKRDQEVVLEDKAIDWSISDYDPYGRTKKFCEHMVRELLPDVPLTFFRPSIVMGDTRFPQTTQFDMVRAFCFLVDLPIVPMRADTRLDIVPADFVGEAIARLHLAEKTKHQIYHLSAGRESKTAMDLAKAVQAHVGKKRLPSFVPRLGSTFDQAIDFLAGSQRRNVVTLVGSLLKVFWPYITYDTVFDNHRVTEELGKSPAPFTNYCGQLYTFSKEHDFSYNYATLPKR